MNPYEKTLWKNGDLITADKMNKIEEQVDYLTENDGGGGSAADSVLYVAQELTDAQKEQARVNIGATSDSELNTIIPPDVPDRIESQTLFYDLTNFDPSALQIFLTWQVIADEEQAFNILQEDDVGRIVVTMEAIDNNDQAVTKTYTQSVEVGNTGSINIFPQSITFNSLKKINVVSCYWSHVNIHRNLSFTYPIGQRIIDLDEKVDQIDSTSNNVQYVSQTLTIEQQTQARENIGAADSATADEWFKSEVETVFPMDSQMNQILMYEQDHSNHTLVYSMKIGWDNVGYWEVPGPFVIENITPTQWEETFKDKIIDMYAKRSETGQYTDEYYRDVATYDTAKQEIVIDHAVSLEITTPGTVPQNTVFEEHRLQIPYLDNANFKIIRRVKTARLEEELATLNSAITTTTQGLAAANTQISGLEGRVQTLENADHSGSTTDAVLYTSQALTDEQQATARNNINAAANRIENFIEIYPNNQSEIYQLDSSGDIRRTTNLQELSGETFCLTNVNSSDLEAISNQLQFTYWDSETEHELTVSTEYDEGRQILYLFTPIVPDDATECLLTLPANKPGTVALVQFDTLNSQVANLQYAVDSLKQTWTINDGLKEYVEVSGHIQKEATITIDASYVVTIALQNSCTVKSYLTSGTINNITFTSISHNGETAEKLASAIIIGLVGNNIVTRFATNWTPNEHMNILGIVNTTTRQVVGPLFENANVTFNY